MAGKALAWLIVPAFGLAELAGHLYFSTRAPDLAGWRAARPAVAALRQHGEVVVVAPDWAEPGARAAFGDALMPVADVARPDVSARARAIEVSIVGATAPELRGWKVAGEQRVGKIRLRVLDNPSPVRVLYDFVDQVREATVVDARPSGETPCPWNPRARRSAGGLHGDPAFPGERHQCPGSESHFVGVTVIEDGDWRGRRCVWAEPTPGAALTVRFHDVPIGKVIRGHATLPWWTERELRGAPVQMIVVVAGQELGTYVHTDGDGWKAFEIRTGTHEGTRADVEFRVTARSHERQFCFEADTR